MAKTGSPPKVTIGGYVVLAGQPVSIVRRFGPNPSQLALRLPAASADSLTASAGRDVGYQLLITGVADETLSSGPWYWANQQPTESPQVGAIVFEDRRRWWGSRYLNRSYNLRRRVGFERAVPVGQEGNFATEQVVPDVAWRQRTLIDGVRPWTALEILEDVLVSVDPDAPIVYDDSVGEVEIPPVDDVVITGYGNDAVSQALRQLPELTVTITAAGAIKVYSRAAGLREDEALARQLEPHVKGSSALLVQDLAPVCPPEVHVLFQIEAEVRVDALEGNKVSQGSSVGGVQPEPPVSEPERTMSNVVVVPDYEIDIDGQTVVQGTYANWDGYRRALGNAPTGVPVETVDFQRAAIPGSSVMQSFAEIGKLGETDDNWPIRIEALAGAYRKLYRLPRAWVDSSIAIKPTRVATVDQQTGARAPSIVLADHFVIPSDKARIRQGETGEDWVQLGRNVAGWTPALDADTIPAPARVSVEDEEQGIVRFNFLTDPWGESALVLPSQINVLRVPVSAPRKSQDSRAVAMNAVIDIGVLPRLADDHAIATVLTMIPVPDTEARMYRVVVRPEDVRSKLPPEVFSVVSRARGQIQEIGISPGNDQTARIPWSEQAAPAIEKLFLAPNGIRPDELQPYVVNDAPRTNVANDRGASNGPSLRIIAEAVAVRRWSTFARHLQGTLVSGQRAGFGLELGGYAETIVSDLTTTGARTTISYSAQLPLYDWQTILDPGTRALLFRQVLRGGGQ